MDSAPDNDPTPSLPGSSAIYFDGLSNQRRAVSLQAHAWLRGSSGNRRRWADRPRQAPAGADLGAAVARRRAQLRRPHPKGPQRHAVRHPRVSRLNGARCLLDKAVNCSIGKVGRPVWPNQTDKMFEIPASEPMMRLPRGSRLRCRNLKLTLLPNRVSSPLSRDQLRPFWLRLDVQS